MMLDHLRDHWAMASLGSSLNHGHINRLFSTFAFSSAYIVDQSKFADPEVGTMRAYRLLCYEPMVPATSYATGCKLVACKQQVSAKTVITSSCAGADQSDAKNVA